MKRVELYGRVRHAVMIEGLSQREAARCFGIDPRTVRKMLSYSVPPGYVRTRPPVRPKLDPFIGIIDRILEEDKDRPKKQRHTSKRIFERLRDEYGFTGKITIVKDYICGVRQRRREMFVPLTHPPGHAQVDFGEALAVIGGVERKIHFLAMSLPHSDACFVKAYPGETTEAFCDGHVSGFSFFGGVPRSILYDNTRIAVARILGDGKRQRTRVFSELRSHYLFEDRFGRPGKGNDKGKVEGIVGYCRRNFLVPMPRFRNFDDLNTHLEACCAKRWAEQLRGHDRPGVSVGERLERDRADTYDACDKRPGRVGERSWIAMAAPFGRTACVLPFMVGRTDASRIGGVGLRPSTARSMGIVGYCRRERPGGRSRPKVPGNWRDALQHASRTDETTCSASPRSRRGRATTPRAGRWRRSAEE